MNVMASLFRCVYGPIEKTIYQFLLLLDRMRGLDFYRIVEYQIDDGCDYECTHLRMHRMLRSICRDASPEDSLLDVGCGKGRMLWFFSRCGFQRVDGIEYNPDIAAIAGKNMERLKISSHVFTMDACDFTLWGNYTWFYFYNPFPERVMELCLKKMLESVQIRPRTLHILYANPVCHRKLLELGFQEQPVKRGAWEKLWFPYLSVLKRYRYTP